MNKHNFVFREKLGDLNIYEIFCSKTGGSFSNAIWIKDKYARQKCPCCEEVIR